MTHPQHPTAAAAPQGASSRRALPMARRSSPRPLPACRQAAAAWLATAALCALPGVAGAADAPLAYEGFDYRVGTLLGGLDGGSGWTSPWQFTEASSLSGRIVEGLGYTDAQGAALAVGGGAWSTDPLVFFAQARRSTAASFGAAGSSVWLSMLVRQSATPDFGVNYAAATVGRDYSFGSNAMAGGLGSSGAFVAPFYSNEGTNAPNVAPASSTSFIVLRLDFAAAGNDTMSLWLNPLLGSDPGAALISASYRNYDPLFGGVTLAFGDARTFVFDELRIGTSYAAVTPSVPEPAAWMLLASGLLALPAWRRRLQAGGRAGA